MYVADFGSDWHEFQQSFHLCSSVLTTLVSHKAHCRHCHLSEADTVGDAETTPERPVSLFGAQLAFSHTSLEI